MNIFYLHDCPSRSASYVYDKHKVKMILESAQMLCTAHHAYNNGDNVPYKQAHLNHPSSIWTRSNTHHYYWLYQHMLALGNEYTKRYGRRHLTITKCAEALLHPPAGMPTIKFERPPQCMPDEYKKSNAIHGYWRYYIIDKRKICNKNEKPYTYSTIPRDVIENYNIDIGSIQLLSDNNNIDKLQQTPG